MSGKTKYPPYFLILSILYMPALIVAVLFLLLPIIELGFYTHLDFQLAVLLIFLPAALLFIMQKKDLPAREKKFLSIATTLALIFAEFLAYFSVILILL